MSSAALLLQNWFPHTTTPFICSAPMRAIAGTAMASAVTNAGGLGFLGAGYHFPNLKEELAEIRKTLSIPSELALPVGVGFISHTSALEEALPALLEQKVQAVWLSFPKDSTQHRLWFEALKSHGESWRIKIFVQVGSVATAVEALELGADALVVQGCDAGGHGWKLGASLVTLLPEIADLLEAKGLGEKIPLIAAGGIMDGRGLVAALALGAHGVSMGTKLVASTESLAHASYKALLVETKDGGQTTTRTHLYDSLRGTRKEWPDIYNGRAIKNTSWTDDENGLSEDDNKLKYIKAITDNDFSRLVAFAGTGVGLINGVESSADVIKNTQSEARKILQRVSGVFASRT